MYLVGYMCPNCGYIQEENEFNRLSDEIICPVCDGESDKNEWRFCKFPEIKNSNKKIVWNEDMNYNVGEKIIYLQNNCHVMNKPRKCVIVRKYRNIFGSIKHDIRPIDSDVIWQGVKGCEIECKLTSETEKNYFGC